MSRGYMAKRGVTDEMIRAAVAEWLATRPPKDKYPKKEYCFEALCRKWGSCDYKDFEAAWIEVKPNAARFTKV